MGPEAIAYDPEKLLNYEAGVKGLWLDGNLSADVSLFYMDRQDMQLRSSAQFTDNPNDFVFITSNAEGHSWGLESQLAWQAQRHLAPARQPGSAGVQGRRVPPGA